MKLCALASVSNASHNQGFQVGILEPNSRNLPFFKVVWHVRHSLAFFWPFLMALA